MPAEIIDRENRRQRAVESLGLTQPVQSEKLDRITRVAKSMFGVAFSSITVLDQDRALYVGKAGFDDAVGARSDTPCRLVIESGEVVTTDDARTDPRFAEVGNIAAFGLGFYVGYPLKDKSGNVVGSLCLIDQEPRQLSADEMHEFEDLAAWAQGELVAEEDAVRAQQTQRALLPAAPLVAGGAVVEGTCIPSLAVGGDYFDYGVIDGRLHVGLGDVMGKGTPAAIMGAGIRAAARAMVPSMVDADTLAVGIGRVELALLSDFQRMGSFATYFHAMLDLTSGVLRWVDAGSGLTLLVSADGSYRRLAGLGLPLGIDRQAHDAHETQLVAGDRLVLISDGVLDILDSDDWVAELAPVVRDADASRDVLDAITALTIARVPLDDVTVVVLEYRP